MGRLHTVNGRLRSAMLVLLTGFALLPSAAATPEEDTGGAAGLESSEMQGGRKVPPGRWRRLRQASLSPELQAQMEKLESIGYTTGSRPAPSGTGVTRYEPRRTQPGLNLVNSAHAPEATLMTSDGKTVHRWHRGFFDFWDGSFPVIDRHPGTFNWRRAYLLDGGDLLVIYEGLAIARLGPDSEVRWFSPCRAHHAAAIDAVGHIWVLARTVQMRADVKPGTLIIEDYVVVLDAQGKEIRRFSLIDAFQGTPFEVLSQTSVVEGGDAFHTNALKILDGRAAGGRAAFRKGNLLMSFCYLNTIAALDAGSGKVVWSCQGTFRRQHDPQLLGAGSLLLFDNGDDLKSSAVVEIDPATGRSLWEYRGTEKEPFWSRTCGTAQRLSNGNTLITESDAGRAFEVTRDGEIVWEFLNPHRAGDEGEFIATLFEVVRVDEPKWLSEPVGATTRTGP